MNANFQRKNSKSNAAEGKAFELITKEYFEKYLNIQLIENFKIGIGVSSSREKKLKAFDLGSDEKIAIECKSHTWTEGNNIPSAKLTTWNEAMYYFFLVPKGIRKLFVVEKSFSKKRNMSLADYYIKIYSHLIPDDVELWEFDTVNKRMTCLKDVLVS